MRAMVPNVPLSKKEAILIIEEFLIRVKSARQSREIRKHLKTLPYPVRAGYINL
jgi:hypothetical protein